MLRPAGESGQQRDRLHAGLAEEAVSDPDRLEETGLIRDLGQIEHLGGGGGSEEHPAVGKREPELHRERFLSSDAPHRPSPSPQALALCAGRGEPGARCCYKRATPHLEPELAGEGGDRLDANAGLVREIRQEAKRSCRCRRRERSRRGRRRAVRCAAAGRWHWDRARPTRSTATRRRTGGRGSPPRFPAPRIRCLIPVGPRSVRRHVPGWGPG